MRLLLIASDAREFTGVMARAAGVKDVRLPVDWAREARLAGHDILMAANGVGMARAAAAVDAALDAWRPDAIVSAGFCGAVDSSLGIAGVVVASCVAGPDGEYPALPVTSGRAFHGGRIRTVERIARTPEEKRQWRASGAIAVEMEAAGVAARARTLGLPFYCIRAVTDLAGETLANDFNSALRPDGHFATIRLLASSLRRPVARLPELVRLRKRCVRASFALGEFIAGCRF
ncbi:MAG: hypothetical protein ABSC23_18665 [Bryobacteraceae bacterium]|jgi:nucleoside phosphorylase